MKSEKLTANIEGKTIKQWKITETYNERLKNAKKSTKITPKDWKLLKIENFEEIPRRQKIEKADFQLLFDEKAAKMSKING